MSVAAGERTCPKCDADLYAQSDGSVWQIDIAHHGETVAEALDKLAEIIANGQAGYVKSIRLIVGGGLINQEVMAALRSYQRNGEIAAFDYDRSNNGAVLVDIRT
jgi:hypothetical protein